MQIQFLRFNFKVSWLYDPPSLLEREEAFPDAICCKIDGIASSMRRLRIEDVCAKSQDSM